MHTRLMCATTCNREIQNKLGGKAIERPQIDVSRHVWHGLVNEAFGMKLRPSFDPYTSANHFLLAAYMLPYISYTTYVGLNMHVEGHCAQEVTYFSHLDHLIHFLLILTDAGTSITWQ